MGTLGSEQRDTLVEDLKHLVPLCPKVAAGIYEKANVSLNERMLAMFQTSTSVLQILKKEHTFSKVVEDARARDTNLLRRFFSRRAGAGSDVMDWAALNPAVCPTALASHIRRSLYPDIVNPSEPCLQHQVSLMR